MRATFRCVFLLSASLAIAVAGHAAAASLVVQVVDQARMPVGDAVVYAVPSAAGAAVKAPTTVEISQQRKTFIPLVTVVQTGTAVSFPNRDAFRHEVYSFSPAKVFQLKLYAALPAAPVVFDKPGLVVLGCNIHDAMLAFVLVVDTPYFGKTAADGRVRIDGMQGGDYNVSVWHAKAAAQAAPRPVPVVGDASLGMVVELKVEP